MSTNYKLVYPANKEWYDAKAVQGVEYLIERGAIGDGRDVVLTGELQDHLRVSDRDTTFIRHVMIDTPDFGVVASDINHGLYIAQSILDASPWLQGQLTTLWTREDSLIRYANATSTFDYSDYGRKFAGAVLLVQEATDQYARSVANQYHGSTAA